MTVLQKEVLEFMRANPIMSAAVNNEKSPISTVLLFAIDDDFKIHFAARRSSFKAKALEKDPRISISVWKMGEMMIQATGRVSEVAEGEKVESILDKLADRVGVLEGFWPPVLQIQSSEYEIFEIEVGWLRKLDLTANSISDNGEVFTQII